MKLKFTGHDTFPLRYSWSYKAVNFFRRSPTFSLTSSSSIGNAICELGVGKNMLAALRYWAECACLIERSSSSDDFLVSRIGVTIFDSDHGFDPYLEDINTIWLLHFLLTFNKPYINTVTYFFGYSGLIYFEKDKLFSEVKSDLNRLVGLNEGSSHSVKDATVRKDNDCFLLTYSKPSESDPQNLSKKQTEDRFMSPLSELGLIKDLGRGTYQGDFEDRPTLSIHIFLYALLRYLNDVANTQLVSFEDLLSMPDSPGRIFRLNEVALARLLDDAVRFTSGGVSWVDSLGLRQVSVSDEFFGEADSLIVDYYQAALK